MLFEQMRRATRTNDAAKSGEVERGAGLQSYSYGRPHTPPVRNAADIQRTVRDNYERITWVYSAVRAISQNAARLRTLMRVGDPDVGDIDARHPLLPLLNYRSMPNSYSPASFMRTRLSQQLLLSSRGAFVEVMRSNAGNPIGLSLLPAQSTRPIPDAELFVSGYEVEIGATRYTIPADNVLWFRNPHPLDPYRSMTPLEAAGIAIDTDWLAALFNKTFLTNDGRPGGLVVVKGNLSDADADELKNYFSGGGRAGQWRVLEGDGIDAKDMSTTPRDAQWLEARGASKTEILAAFGTPPTVLGDTAGRTFDNADVDREVFWQETMLPHLDLHSDVWDQLDDDPNTYLRYDLSQVAPLQRADMRRRQELRDEYDRGLRTIDEYRGSTPDLAPLDTAATRTLYMGMGLAPLTEAGPARLPALPVDSTVVAAAASTATKEGATLPASDADKGSTFHT